MKREEIIAAARKQVQELSEAFVMGTVAPDGKPHVFYMGAMVFEEPFNLYVETWADSEKVRHVQKNPNVEIVIARPDYSQVVTLTGTAALETSPQAKKKVWDKISLSGMYFSGPEAPEFGVIKVAVRQITLQESADDPRQSHVATV
jgi:general stress protein 26